jgi:hypothetical protein
LAITSRLFQAFHASVLLRAAKPMRAFPIPGQKRQKGLPFAHCGVNSAPMNPTQKQFSLNRRCHLHRLTLVFLSWFLSAGMVLSVLAEEGLHIMRAVELQLDTQADKTYELQSSTNLLDWTNEEQLTGTGGSLYRLESLRGNEQRYYRLVALTNSEPNYFPLAVGNRWVYDGGYGNGNRVDTILSIETIAGRQTYKWQRQEAAPDNYMEQRWLYKEGGALQIAQMWGNQEPLTTVTTFTSPWTWLKAQPSPLDTWVFEGDLTGAHVKITMTIHAVGVQVTTPAGVFNGCVVVRTHSEISQNGQIIHDYNETYFAPNVGAVQMLKCQADWLGTHPQRLIEYTVSGN